MNSIVISYDKDMEYISVYSAEEQAIDTFQFDEDYEIIEEHPDSDSEDFNDNARWLARTLLAILKLEKEDDCAHCDWSADFDENPETGKYKFEVSIKKVKDEEIKERLECPY